ncbi:hypothetical protein [Sphingomonas xinjiangensis]|uniref:Uncharacterized protein n=1 Tax=Sphingomonas xinjiangensis TaxID=643568 RepID=A0A840YTW9_9SPHN|nr:hypothetical protein [Sphingomonas xinjiangensis]MBB5713134.1 hypothetical protein [Sphingomonas xinjiangensis]
MIIAQPVVGRTIGAVKLDRDVLIRHQLHTLQRATNAVTASIKKPIHNVKQHAGARPAYRCVSSGSLVFIIWTWW